MTSHATLFFMCGKMAAGKSTLARELAKRHEAVLFVQDDLLEALYPGEITEIAHFIGRSARLRTALAPYICLLLARGVSVVLDFPGNVAPQRAWFRELFEQAGVGHELHFIDLPDHVCKRQLRNRSAHLPEGTPWTTAAEFDAVAAYFQPPSAEEGFTIVHHSGR